MKNEQIKENPLEKRSRKNKPKSRDLIMRIYNCLDEPKTLHRISKEVNCNWTTARHNIRLLLDLRVVIRIGGSPKTFVRHKIPSREQIFRDFEKRVDELENQYNKGRADTLDSVVTILDGYNITLVTSWIDDDGNKQERHHISIEDFKEKLKELSSLKAFSNSKETAGKTLANNEDGEQ